MEPVPTPELPPPQPLPIISEETRTQLLEELGLDIDPRTNRIVQGISGETAALPRNLGSSLTANTFGDLIDYNRELVQAIDEELTKVQQFPRASTERTLGMAVILRAFEINSGFDLISRFKSLEAQDIEIVRRTIQETLSKDSDNLPILKRLLNIPRIPEQQVALNEVVRKADFAGITIFKGCLPEGATTMYRILSRLWPKLYPQNQTPSAQPPTNL